MNVLPTPLIRPVADTDASAVADVYNWYVENSTATFELDAVSAVDMVQRIALADANNPWSVIEIEGVVVGYAFIAPWKTRAAYGQAKETSVYVRHDFVGCGLGYALMKSLIENARLEPIHTLIAGITLPNRASVALHEKLGFKPAGRFEQVGYKFGQYIDVGYWQLLMET